jgi:DNA-binding transcriptional MocR family regulator
MSKKGFTIVPNALILDEDLSNDAKVLFAYIKSLSENYRHLRNRTLRQKLGISLNTLQNCKAELVKRGYLIIHRSQSSNYYRLKLKQTTQQKSNQSTQEKNNQTTQNFGNIKRVNNSSYNTNYRKRKNKGFKKFND